jgi:uncharacterized membrane protein HdeD (DUF308 family)
MLRDDVRSIYRTTKLSLTLRGLAGIAIGIFILARPMTSIAALALVIALWALFDGIAAIVHSFDLRGVAPHWWVVLLIGIVGVVFGVDALWNYPGLSLTFAVIWVALWLLTGGAMGLYAAFLENKAGLSWGWTLVWGLVAIAAGILAAVYPNITLGALIGVLAAFAIASGAARLAAAATLGATGRRVRDTLADATHRA